MLCANEFQIGGLHCACVRKVPWFLVRWGEGRKGTQKRKKKTVVKKCWLLKLSGNVTSALHQKFLQTYKIKEFAFITHCEAHMEKWKTLHHLTSAWPLSTTDEYCVQKF